MSRVSINKIYVLKVRSNFRDTGKINEKIRVKDRIQVIHIYN